MSRKSKFTKVSYGYHKFDQEILQSTLSWPFATIQKNHLENMELETDVTDEMGIFIPAVMI